MGFLGALKSLNSLKEDGIIKDYAIAGGYAVSYYLEPSVTYDLDILALIESDNDLHEIYTYFGEKGNRIENVYVIIDGLAVQFFPSYISPLFQASIEDAHKIKIEGVPSKIVRAEYLIALLLNSFRPKDKMRISELLEIVDRRLLDKILRGFGDDKNLLGQRFGKVLETI